MTHNPNSVKCEERGSDIHEKNTFNNHEKKFENKTERLKYFNVKQPNYRN